MPSGSNLTLHETEKLVHETWDKLIPRLEAVDVDILAAYLRVKSPVSPYRIARMLGMNITSVYRRSRRLLEHRLLIPGFAPTERDRLMISVKGCLYLYLRGRIDTEALAECFSTLWGIEVTPRSLLPFLYLLGVEASRRKLDIKTLTMCRPEEAAVHVLRYLMRALELYEKLGVGFREALDSVAYSVYLDGTAFRDALRLALRAAAGRIFPVIKERGHEIVVLVSGRSVYPLVLHCNTPCREYWESLGIECSYVYSELLKLPCGNP